MGGKRVSDSERRKMAQLAKQGLRPPEIAKRLNRNHTTVVRVLREQGVVFRHGPTPVDARVRFEAYLPKNRDPGRCWPFQGGISGGGYGQFALDGRRSIGAHVASYRLFKGRVPKNKLVMHTCDNRRCVNPDHLVLGTQKQNMEDCVEKRRIAKGEQQGLAQMTRSKVRDLRARYEAGETQVQLAKAFGISQPTVSQIVRRKTWVSA